MNILTRAAICLLAVSTAVASGRFSAEQLEAKFPYDLGPNQVDVSAYPKEQRDNYQVFLKTCSQCHSAARPINSPLTTRADWKRFIARMHLKTKATPTAVISVHEAKAILSFLAYDSAERKVKNKTVFGRQATELQQLFTDVKTERLRFQQQADQKNIKPYSDAPGASPRAQ